MAENRPLEPDSDNSDEGKPVSDLSEQTREEPDILRMSGFFYVKIRFCQGIQLGT